MAKFQAVRLFFSEEYMNSKHGVGGKRGTKKKTQSQITEEFRYWVSSREGASFVLAVIADLDEYQGTIGGHDAVKRAVAQVRMAVRNVGSAADPDAIPRKYKCTDGYSGRIAAYIRAVRPDFDVEPGSIHWKGDMVAKAEWDDLMADAAANRELAVRILSETANGAPAPPKKASARAKAPDKTAVA